MIDRTKIRRNVVIYALGVWALASVGGAITAATGSELGGLLFILSPIVVATLLRFWGGDGWADAGLGLRLKESWRTYLLSIVIYPLTFGIVLALGISFGLTTANGDLRALLPSLLAALAAQLIPRMIFALFEEWGWRGYLEPRLAALGVADVPRHLAVGIVWALWHIPLILSTPYTEIPYWMFLPAFVIGVTIAAVVYGQLRKHSGTVWPAVLMHGVANTVAWALLQTNAVTVQDKVLANFTPESVLMIAVWGVLAAWLAYQNSRVGRQP